MNLSDDGNESFFVEGGSGIGEHGVEVDAVAEVVNDQERRAALLGRQGGDVTADLVIGAFEDLVEGDGAALEVSRMTAPWAWADRERDGLLAAGLRHRFGLHLKHRQRRIPTAVLGVDEHGIAGPLLFDEQPGPK